MWNLWEPNGANYAIKRYFSGLSIRQSHFKVRYPLSDNEFACWFNVRDAVTFSVASTIPRGHEKDLFWNDIITNFEMNLWSSNILKQHKQPSSIKTWSIQQFITLRKQKQTKLRMHVRAKGWNTEWNILNVINPIDKNR